MVRKVKRRNPVAKHLKKFKPKVVKNKKRYKRKKLDHATLDAIRWICD